MFSLTRRFLTTRSLIISERKEIQSLILSTQNEIQQWNRRWLDTIRQTTEYEFKPEVGGILAAMYKERLWLSQEKQFPILSTSGVRGYSGLLIHASFLTDNRVEQTSWVSAYWREVDHLKDLKILYQDVLWMHDKSKK